MTDLERLVFAQVYALELRAQRVTVSERERRLRADYDAARKGEARNYGNVLEVTSELESEMIAARRIRAVGKPAKPKSR